MRRAQVLTFWAGNGLTPETAYTPDVARFGLAAWTDTTAQPGENLPPTPNLVIIEIVCDPAVLDAIAADPAYGPETILTNEEA